MPKQALPKWLGSDVQNSKLPRRAFSTWIDGIAAILNSVRLTPSRANSLSPNDTTELSQGAR
jgi:hypothetical protein